MNNSFKNVLINILGALKAPLLSILEKEAVKVAIAKLIQSPWMLDFRMWAIKFAVDYIIKDFAKPMVDYFFRKVGYEYEVIDGKYLFKEIQNATNGGEWEHSSDRV